MKTCKGVCGLEKDISEFSKNKQKSDGLDIYCKPCKKEKRKKYSKPIKDKEILESNIKRCYNCKEIKQLSEFGKMKVKSDGLNHNCNICKNNKQRELHKNKEVKEVNIKNKVCILCNVDKPSCEFNSHKGMKDGLRSYCRVCQSKNRKEYHSIEENKERSNTQSKIFCDSHKKERNERKNERYKNDEQFKIKHNLRYNTKNIGCTSEFFKKWLQFQFDSKMTWDNKGLSTKFEDKWEIDHIIGYSNFDLTNDYEKSLCTHWTNVQPMWGNDNKEKSSNIKLHQVMNSVINVHRFIQHTNTNKDGYVYLRNRLKFLRELK